MDQMEREAVEKDCRERLRLAGSVIGNSNLPIIMRVGKTKEEKTDRITSSRGRWLRRILEELLFHTISRLR